MRTDGQTADRYDEAHGRFSKFCELTRKLVHVVDRASCNDSW